MARKLNLSNPFIAVGDGKHVLLNPSRKVGYKTKYRTCKNPQCNKGYKANRSDQLYCTSVCQGVAAAIRRAKRDKEGSKLGGIIKYILCSECKHSFAKRTANGVTCSHSCAAKRNKRIMREKYRDRKGITTESNTPV